MGDLSAAPAILRTQGPRHDPGENRPERNHGSTPFPSRGNFQAIRIPRRPIPPRRRNGRRLPRRSFCSGTDGRRTAQPHDRTSRRTDHLDPSDTARCMGHRLHIEPGARRPRPRNRAWRQPQGNRRPQPPAERDAAEGQHHHKGHRIGDVLPARRIQAERRRRRGGEFPDPILHQRGLRRFQTSVPTRSHPRHQHESRGHGLRPRHPPFRKFQNRLPRRQTQAGNARGCPAGK